MPQWYVFKTTNKAIEYFCKNRDILAMKRPNEDINGISLINGQKILADV